MKKSPYINVVEVIHKAHGLSDSTSLRKTEVIKFIADHQIDVIETQYGKGVIRLMNREVAEELIAKLRRPAEPVASAEDPAQLHFDFSDRLDSIEQKLTKLGLELTENTKAVNVLIQSQNRLNDQLQSVLRELGSPSAKAA